MKTIVYEAALAAWGGNEVIETFTFEVPVNYEEWLTMRRAEFIVDIVHHGELGIVSVYPADETSKVDYPYGA